MRCPLLVHVFLSLGVSAALASSPGADDPCAAFTWDVGHDQRLWVDAIANGTVIQAKDFQGRAGCSAPHKVVEFLLPAKTPMTIQFSGASVATVKVTVTRSPAVS